MDILDILFIFTVNYIEMNMTDFPILYFAQSALKICNHSLNQIQYISIDIFLIGMSISYNCKLFGNFVSNFGVLDIRRQA